MKTKLLIAFLLAHLTAMGQITTTGGYCSAEFDGGSIPNSHYISSFSFGSFTNVSGVVQQPFPHYIFYNNLSPGPYHQGTPFPVSIDVDSIGDKHLDIFIDLNRDGVLSDVTERLMSVDVNAGVTNVTGNVSIPFTTMNGTTRLRLVLFEDNAYSMAPACFYQLDWGESEDYQIQIGITASINENRQDNFHIHPNPASDVITIESDMQIEKIELFDLTAKKLLAIENNLSGSLDIGMLEPGIYILKVRSTSGVEARKLIVKE